MEFYKAKVDGAIIRKTNDANIKSGEEVASWIKKGELILVKSVEEEVDKNLFLPTKKYTIWNGNYAFSVDDEQGDRYVKASFSDIPEYLFIEIQKPTVYIVIGVILAGLATYSIIKERQNN